MSQDYTPTNGRIAIPGHEIPNDVDVFEKYYRGERTTEKGETGWTLDYVSNWHSDDLSFPPIGELADPELAAESQMLWELMDNLHNSIWKPERDREWFDTVRSRADAVWWEVRDRTDIEWVECGCGSRAFDFASLRGDPRRKNRGDCQCRDCLTPPPTNEIVDEIRECREDALDELYVDQ